MCKFIKCITDHRQCVSILYCISVMGGGGGQWYCTSGHTWQYFRMILKTCVVLPINPTPMLSRIMRLLLWRTISERCAGRIPWINDAKLLVTVPSSWLPTTTKTDRRLLLVTTLPLISVPSCHMGKPGARKREQTNVPNGKAQSDQSVFVSSEMKCDWLSWNILFHPYLL